MSIRRTMKSVPSEPLPAKGLLYHDHDAITECQRECLRRLCHTIQMEQEAYISQHPEILAMMEMFICKMALQGKRKCNFIKEAGQYFLGDLEELESDIRKHLEVQPGEPFTKGKFTSFKYEDDNLIKDIREILMKHYPPESWQTHSSAGSPPITVSSSFISLQTSDTTLPTPEPVKTPEPTFTDIVFSWVSAAVDKAIFFKLNPGDWLYDGGYVALMECVENAMEIPVTAIREDIAQLMMTAMEHFEEIIDEKNRAAAEIAWDKRMRKKMKRSLRRKSNFKGYETPPTPKSTISTHSSYKKPFPRPCKCHPQYNYNRYEKDRFGIYLPRDKDVEKGNTTVTPAISLESLDEPKEEGQAEDGQPKEEGSKSPKSRASARSRGPGRLGRKANVTVKSVPSFHSGTSGAATDVADESDMSKAVNVIKQAESDAVSYRSGASEGVSGAETY